MATTTRRPITLLLTRDQAGLIVEGLVERPFRQVFELIGQLHSCGGWAGGASACCSVTPTQLRLILQTLGAMPFSRVSGLLQSLHQQLRVHQPGHADE